MGKVICRCGQQVRTTAKSGTQFECPRCQCILTVTEKVLDAVDRIHAPLIEPLESPTTTRLNRSSVRVKTPESESQEPEIAVAKGNSNYLGLLLGFAFLATALGLILSVILWPSKKTVSPSQVSSTATATHSQAQEPGWASIGKWTTDFSSYPSGNQMQSLIERINTSGQALDSRGFWSQIDQKSFQERMLSTEGSLRALEDRLSAEKVIDKLGSFPIESVSVPSKTFTSDWEIIGIAQKGKEIGVLVRYFLEPLDISELIYSDDWIRNLEKLISFDEYFVVAKDLCAARTNATDSPQDDAPKIEDQVSPRQGIFTPFFGYMVLIVDSSSERVNWTDVVSLPGDVRLSRASGVLYEEDWVAFKNRVDVKEKSVPNGWSPEGTIDVFGEYRSNVDESLAKDLVFAENRPDSTTALRLEQSLPTISPERTKMLIAIAQSAVSNYGELKQRVSDFQKAYPTDFGCDALLISLWLRFHDGKRSGMAFEDFGSVFVDATNRLYATTKDGLLMEMKARIYKSNGQNEESDKQLELAEKSGKKSAFMFMRRIEQGIQEGDKNKILKYLSQFSAYWIEQPGVTVQLDPKSLSRKILRKWAKDTAEPKKG